MLRLDSQPRGERQRSCVAVSHEIKRWCGLADNDARELQRGLWRRMAFNAVCGHGDDHRRNHGLLLADGRWAWRTPLTSHLTSPSPARWRWQPRETAAHCPRANLLKNCDNFAYDDKEAAQYIKQEKDTISADWGDELALCGHPRDWAPVPTSEWLGADTGDQAVSLAARRGEARARPRS
ncbi:MAG: hypothetical protein NVS2B4_14710 [Ramlibacter sp.]